ncbi:hypothetical protein DBR27_04320 [Flavobacterium sp. HMWF030]|nr:hypothetical protein DBR27_04320 [Flavobacterium sp. HMWF030]
MSEFEELFKQVVNGSKKNKGKFTLTVGTVKAIENDTCTVDNYEDVRLNAIIEDTESQFTIYPKVGSKVIIGRLENEDNAFVLGVSEIEKVIIKMSDQLFEMKDGKFTIKNGNLSLKSILNDGFDQLNKAIITTPSGPGRFSPADKLVFTDLKDKTNQLLS